MSENPLERISASNFDFNQANSYQRIPGSDRPRGSIYLVLSVSAPSHLAPLKYQGTARERICLMGLGNEDG